jgi:transposase
MRSFRTWNPEQSLLFPVSPRDWLRPDHLVYCILDVVTQLDLSAIECRYRARDARGEKAYHPAMMTALLLYGYAIGMPSSRRLERATHEDVAMRVLTGGQHPDHTRISEFRRENLQELAGLFVQMLRICQKAGLVKLGHVALDGTKVKASASKHKAMSYQRMLKSEQELASEVKRLLEQAERVDVDEDARFGRGVRGDELPEELRRREERLARLRQAKAELEAEAAAEHRAKQRGKNGDADGSGQGGQGRSGGSLPRHRVQTDRHGRPRPKAQRNFTDPDSQIMKHQGGFIQGYNGQVAADGEHQVIVAQALTNQAPDAEHLAPMIGQIEANVGSTPRRLSADAGYWSEDNVTVCEEEGVDPFIATGRLKHGEVVPPVRGRPPKGLDAKGRMHRKLRTKKGQAVYARRKAIVEPCIGQIKNRGFWRLLLRGLEKSRGEWALITATHNLLKYYRVAWQPV